TIMRVRAFDRDTRTFVDFTPDACGFAYRTSRFQGSNRYVITEVTFRLARSPLSAPLRYPELTRALGVPDGGRAPLADVRRHVIQLRRGKGMVVDPNDPESRSAGSFFTNPIVDAQTFAALIERLPAG